MINKVIFSIFVICTVLQQNLYFTYTFMIHRHFGFYTEKPAIQEVVSIAFDITYFYLLSSDKIINNT